MEFVIAASDEQWDELTGLRPGADWQRVGDATAFKDYKNADAFFSLKDNTVLADLESLNKPVFLNSVVQTLAELEAPANVCRINGWPGFLKRPVWEIAGNAADETPGSIFKPLNIKINAVEDEPGFISARIIAMIINEGYFALEDHVSSKAEIDTAMKLGTNYPYGPFEWATLIGKSNILALLQKLSLTDTRYLASQLLIKEVKENTE